MSNEFGGAQIMLTRTTSLPIGIDGLAEGQFLVVESQPGSQTSAPGLLA